MYGPKKSWFAYYQKTVKASGRFDPATPPIKQPKVNVGY